MAKTIFYWRGSAEVRQDIISSLTASKYRVAQFRSIGEIVGRVDRDAPSVLIVDGTGGSREASRMVMELGGTEKLYHLHIVFVGQQATKRCESLANNFASTTPVDIPYRLVSLMQWLEVLLEEGEDLQETAPDFTEEKEPAERVEEPQSLPGTEAVESLPEETAGSRKEEGVEAAALESVQLEEISERAQETGASDVTTVLHADEDTSSAEQPPKIVRDPQIATEAAERAAAEKHKTSERSKRFRRIEENTPVIRARIAANPDPLKLDKSLGGEVFAIARDPDDYQDEYLLPKLKGANISEMLKGLSDEDRWLGAHAKRAAFVSSAMGAKLGFGEERDKTLRVAALFLNWAFRDRPVDLLRYNLIAKPDEQAAGNLADIYNQSALVVEQRLHESRAAAVIRLISDILRHAAPPAKDENLREEAELVFAIELAARACWSLGFWNPAGAYKAIRYYRSPGSLITKGKIQAAMIKMLGEAVTVHITVGNAFSTLFEDPDLAAIKQKERAAITEIAIAAAAQKLALRKGKKMIVEIADLVPGMLLLQPILARDGRVIIDADVTLNKEMLYHLWQLASIRALQGEVEVLVKSKRKTAAQKG